MTTLSELPTIEELGRRLRAGETTSTEITEDCLRRIDAGHARLNAFIRVMAEEARQEARQADAELKAGHDRGPLHGVPISLKDLIDVRGVPTTAASRVREGHVAEHDAPIVTNLRLAGAVLLGKTNLHEFAFGTTNEDSAFGPARNPHDPTRSPGGSSGGSAASVAAGMAVATVGTDTGGSIRIPAAACGLVGLKPTYGEVPADGVVPLSRTLDHVGPLTRTVTDAWLMYRALICEPARPLAPRPASGLRLAVLRPYFCDLLDHGVRGRFDAALAALDAAGARIDEGEIHHTAEIAAAYLHISFGDAAAYHATMLEQKPEAYTPPVRMRLEMARYVQAEDYVRALRAREVLCREVDAAIAGHDALVLPALAIQAPPIGATMAPVGDGEQPVRTMMLRLTQLFNMTQHPAVTIPCGKTPDGLPVGLQLVGARGATEELLRTALACESHIG
jgi:aspartyl-tRNA(Asn)/glutamyl-tRNA(Gln) amidotransferase subunit A